MAELNGNLAQFARASGRKIRRKITVTPGTQKTESRKHKSEPPCVQGTFPVKKRPKSQLVENLL